MTRLEEYQKKLGDLGNEYPEFKGLFVIIENNEHVTWSISSHTCLLCILEHMVGVCEDKNIQHLRVVEYEVH